MINHVVSFSGGRTSAYLVYLIEQMRKSGEWLGNVEYIFMDTGAEHPKTYQFIKNCVEYFDIELVCLRGNFNQEIGDGHTYEVIDIDEIGYDSVSGPYARLVRKYGLPTISSAWCTSRMKEETHDKYCNDRFGAGNYVTWLGIRSDEPKRLNIGKREDLRYMAEITDFEKSDVLLFWKKMPFDLGIDEHLGNCVFCFKKSHGKIALAARDEPKLFMDWLSLLNSGSDRNTAFKKHDLLGEQEFNRDKLAIHRGRKTPQDIIAMFSMFDDHDLREHVYRNTKDSGGCSESCEAFAGQLELI